MEPLTVAKTIYCGSLRSLMAHTIRTVENNFRLHGLGLDVVIIRMPLGDLNGTLNTRLAGRFLLQASPIRVTATIYINERACKELARFTIAHEIYHLLLELEEWTKEKKAWTQLEPSSKMERDCNSFAQALCFLHDNKLYRDEENRKRNVYFCTELFQEAITTGEDGRPNLPEQLALGIGVPYWKVPDPEIEADVFPWL